ncbi:hypothetical protein A1356_11255 [Methylomonas koyamae]|uniref:HNH nuclease domain-containing protein n=2 Tax=Methylomonas koyamae TaxID=702114 RepID=A0AA91DDA3_9GAMM|nr:hypothetical protein A1356_11255 [Methylomonas koyamae]
MLLITLGLPLHTSVVNAFDAPPKDQGHTGPGAGGPDETPADDPGQCGVGDPINIKNGDFNIVEKDIFVPGVGFPLAIERAYDNQNNLKEGPFGFGWTFNYDVTLVEVTSSVNPQVIIQRGDGMKLVFHANADGSFSSPQGRFLILKKSAGVFSLTEKNGNIHRFDSNGRLASISDRNNNQLVFSYDSSGRLIKLADASSKELVFYYNANSKISKIVDPANREFTYAYDVNGNLVNFTDPGANKTEYIYDSMHRMTVKKDAKGIEVEKLTYTDKNKVSQQFFKGGSFNFTYGADYTRVCNRRNFCTDYYYNATGNPIRINQPVIGSSYRTYNQDLTIATYTDESNNSWNFSYDLNGNLTKITDPNLHASQFSFEPKYNKLVSVIDAKNNKTFYDYNINGNLTSITNSLNQKILHVNSYDSHGNPTEVLDANGVKTEIVYDANGRLVSSTSDGAATSFSYDVLGNVIRVIFPDNDEVNYRYDALNRLTEVIDKEGNKVKLTVDPVGNILSREIYDKDSILTHKHEWKYDAYDRMIESVTSDNRKNILSYDANDNLIKLSDALNQNSNSTFDGVDRVIQVTNALSGITKFSYDKVGRLTQVTDPEGLVTQYSYDKVGNFVKLISPDSGQTTNTYDAADNLLTSTDARGIKATYSYDELHRFIGVNFPNAAENIQYTYDDTSNGNYGIGRLTGFNDQSGHTEYRYDAKGQLVNDSHTIEGKNYNSQFQYDAAGKLIQLTYPSGRVVNYNYSTIGNIESVTTTNAGITKTLVSKISYLPFGPIQSMTYGNGLILTQTFDQNYRLLTKETNKVSKLDLAYSAVDNVTILNDAASGEGKQTFAYDALSRLTSATGNYGNLSYSYDKVGNRLTESDDGLTDNYTYATDSHHLASVSGNNNFVFSYDAAGNVIAKDGITFVYNDRGRMAQATNNGVTTDYLYNAKGERVVKKVGSVATHYHYDPFGQLIAETNENGAVIREYVYLGTAALAAIHPSLNGGAVYFVHSDHLGTPKTLTSESGATVWKASHEPFGNTNTSVNLITFNLGFPGQYFDAETGLNYNYFRDYDPAIGRYLQSDPIGLSGGLNTYSYVYNSPLNLIDPSGNIPLDTIWDLGNVIYDIATGDKCALAADLIAMAVPYVPAGITKLPKIANAADKAADVAKAVDKANDATKAVDKANDATKNLVPKTGSAGGKGAGKPFSDKVKDQARAESKDTCVFCGTKTTKDPGPTRSEIDHAIPKSRGGNNTIDNAQNTCRTCNRQKGSKTTDEFLP